MSGPTGARSARARGQRAEEDARRFLAAEGFTILDHNAHARVGEVDVVAREDGVTCFVEVKFRRSGRFGSALQSVGPVKQRRMVLAAQKWLAAQGDGGAVRFDVVVREPGSCGWVLYRDAFRPEAPW